MYLRARLCTCAKKSAPRALLSPKSTCASSTISTVSTLKSRHNPQAYFNTLKNKLNQIKYEPKGNGVGLSSYLLKEHEYLKKSNEDLENKLKNTYDILNKNSQGIK